MAGNAQEEERKEEKEGGRQTGDELSAVGTSGVNQSSGSLTVTLQE